jgi:hypothetical protein
MRMFQLSPGDYRDGLRASDVEIHIDLDYIMEITEKENCITLANGDFYFLENSVFQRLTAVSGRVISVTLIDRP